MRALTIVAHPDDEVLGFGGTAAMLTSQGVQVYSCILCSGVTARSGKPDDSTLREHTLQAQADIGVLETLFGEFPNIAFNTVPHLELVQTIEHAIQKFSPDLLFTHHPNDLNNDHVHTSLACQAAARLFQRRTNRLSLSGLYFMEIPSSTDWAFHGCSQPFAPNAFSEIGLTGLDAKLRALSRYQGVMRDFPHPRSREGITGLAAYRGGQAGMLYAEAFQTMYSRLGFLEASA